MLCALIVATLGLQAGCGGSDDNGTDVSEPVTAVKATGRFVDAAVSNLGYSCTGVVDVATSSGVTDAQGQFDYVAGQVCSFAVGGVVLGSAAGAALLTPYSLVAGSAPGTPNATVTNIVRFLMSIDGDLVADNGIAIAAQTQTALAGKTLDFASPTFDADAAALVALAIPGRALVDAGAAAAHLDLTLLGLYAGGYTCPYRGVVSGTDRVLGNVAISIAEGVITGAGTPIGSTDTFEVAGTIDASGAANLTAGTTSTGATFEGSFVSDGTVAGTRGSGTWSDSGLGSGTWTCQHS
jgi:hypothetical protein